MIPRSAVIRANHVAARQIVLRRPARLPVRLQSTSSSTSSSGSSSSKFDSSHFAAGVAGGLTVVLAGYAWYHTSRLKTMVQSAKEVKNYLRIKRDNVLSKASETAKNPSQALSNLRSTVTSYFQQLFNKYPHAQELVNFARDRSELAKNRAKETVSDVMIVLKEKGKKAKELLQRKD